MLKLPHIVLISHASEVMLKILQARLQQYVNRELPDVQGGFRKGRGTRHQIANIHWIMEKARELQKNIHFCFIDYAKAFDCVDHNKLWKVLEQMGIVHSSDWQVSADVGRNPLSMWTSSLGYLSTLPTWQLASSKANEPSQSKAHIAMPFVI